MYHAELFTYYLERLKATEDGDGSLLDHSMTLYGAGMSNGNIHYHHKLRSSWWVGGRVSSKAGVTSATTTTRRSRTCS